MLAPKADIVVIDDTPENLTLLANVLTEQGYKVRGSTKSSSGLRAIRTVLPDLILLDIFMPEMDGYEVCQHLKADPRTQDIPVIFISALGDVLDKVKAFSLGGVDYITKPFHLEEVIARVDNHLQLQAAKRQIKQMNQVLEQGILERTQALALAQNELRFLAFHDSLTRLPNRVFFLQALEKAILRYQKDPEYSFAVLFLDGDRFKVVNDSLGHLLGDQLLIAVARRLEQSLPTEVLLARIGGDEFTLLIEDLPNPQVATQLAEQVAQSMLQPFIINNHKIFINFSIGICFNTYHSNAESILRDADIAMYRAKRRGRGCYQIFDKQMYEEAQALLMIESDLRQAIRCPSLCLYYQPIIDLNTRTIRGFEALVRWQHPSRGMISPAEFIPIAEDTGLILPLGLWILETACQQMQDWKKVGLVDENMTMGINLSPKQFAQPDLVNRIDSIITKTGLPYRCLKLEITESAILDSVDSSAKIIRELKSRQIQISIDDFGTGYSSLSYLNQFPFNTLKIDRSFVEEVDTNPEKRAIIKTIIELAHTLKMDVVAEGIETNAQKSILRALKCEYGQGYLFSRPLSQADLTHFLRESWRASLRRQRKANLHTQFSSESS
ncbi:EAL domain-containing protein [Synechocystis sp. LKSZ1]|uniref:EAL domain-containing response regulator n=1 Tax=Synechocystis sp. LKSZ1 TaxID=3144951 RepID=UPI00336BE7CB